MRYASLFSGIGGLDRAIDAIGGECVVQVEREPYCLGILGLRWPDVPKVTDVLDYHPAPVDLVVGGPPCQPVSHAGRRKGSADERWLWGEALRIVAEARPQRVFFENPMGLRTLGLDDVIRGLIELGYGGAWEVVAAADVGAPHLRKRIFIMGERGRSGWEGPTRPKGNRGIIWPTPTASERSGSRVGTNAHPGVNLSQAVKRAGVTPAMWPTPSASLGPKAGLVTPDKGREGGTLVEAVSARTWPTPGAGDNRDRGHANMPAIIRRREKGKQLNLSMTVSTERGALSPDWVEWLMGLPTGWTDASVTKPGPLYDWDSEPAIPRIGLGIPNRSKRLTALGNAVVPAQAIFAWQRLVDRLGLMPIE